MSEEQREAIKQEYEKFSVEKLEKYDEAIDDKEQIKFDIEYQGKQDKVYVTVYKHFRKKAIFECIAEYIKQLDKLRKKKLELSVDFLEMYLIFLMIKHFTDIEMPNEIEKQIIVLERLIDTGLLFLIFEEFPQAEIENLLREIDDANESFDENMKAIQEGMESQIDFEKLQSQVVKEFVKE